MEERVIESFLAIGDGRGGKATSGYGNGDGSGSGYGYGSGESYGCGSGNRFGYSTPEGNGDGSGSGYGYGSGDGFGDGYGRGKYGYGYGYGSGTGNGNGDGSGNSDGDLLSILMINGVVLYNIDDVPTAIDNIKGNLAQGRIPNIDLSFTDCWIVRVGDCFAHGENLHEAQRYAQYKHLPKETEEKRLRMFVKTYPDPDKPIPVKDLFDWHGTLTGSCLMGREEWCKKYGLNKENGFYSIRQFVSLTKNGFGGDTIKKLKNYYKNWDNPDGFLRL